MKKYLKYLLLALTLGVMLHTGTVRAEAAVFRTINVDAKEKVGSNYIWRKHNTQFNIIKKNGATRTVKESGYTIWGVTDGNTIYYSVSPAKYATQKTIYKYTISTGKKQKLATLKNAGHIQACYKNRLYLSTSNGNFLIYDLKTKRTGIRKLPGTQTNVAFACGRYVYYYTYTKYPYAKCYVHDLKTRKTTTLAKNSFCFGPLRKGKALTCIKILKKGTTKSGKTAYKCRVYKCNVTNKKMKAFSPKFDLTKLISYSYNKVTYYDTKGRRRSIKY